MPVLGSTGNWQLREDLNFATLPADNIYNSPLVFTSEWLCFLPGNPEAKPTWDYAGYAIRTVSLVLGGEIRAEIMPATKLYLNKNQIIYYPSWGGYSIRYLFPPYFTKGSLRIWEYVGPP